MSIGQILKAVLIHLVTPAMGLAIYIWLCRAMKRAVARPPYLAYFFLFATLGGWLLILLTALFWVWSGMASLGAFYVTFGAPLIAGIFAGVLWRRRQDSPYHRWAYRLCLGYTMCVIVLDITWLTLTMVYHT